MSLSVSMLSQCSQCFLNALNAFSMLSMFSSLECFIKKKTTTSTTSVYSFPFSTLGASLSSSECFVFEYSVYRMYDLRQFRFLTEIRASLSRVPYFFFIPSLNKRLFRFAYSGEWLPSEMKIYIAVRRLLSNVF